MQNYYQRPAFRQPYQNRENSREATREINRQKPCDVKDKLRKEFPVAMAYVPWQQKGRLQTFLLHHLRFPQQDPL